MSGASRIGGDIDGDIDGMRNKWRQAVLCETFTTSGRCCSPALDLGAPTLGAEPRPTRHFLQPHAGVVVLMVTSIAEQYGGLGVLGVADAAGTVGAYTDALQIVALAAGGIVGDV